jgi:hypothetical protein
LEPELDLIEVAKKLALVKLETQGFVVELDFRFTDNGYLQVNKKALAGLMMGISAGERLLLEEIKFLTLNLKKHSTISPV